MRVPLGILALGSLILIGFCSLYVLGAPSNEHSIADCQESHECFGKIIVDEVRKDGLAEGFTLLSEIYEQTPSFRPACHGFTRDLVKSMYEEFQDYQEFDFTVESTWCNYGFQQAYPEALLLYTQDVEQAHQFCQYMTQSLREIVPGAEAECYRGIGRAIPVVTKNPEGSLELSTDKLIAVCSGFSSNQSNYDACVNGVFSGISSRPAEDRSQNSESADPMQLCNELELDLKEKCFSNYKTAAFPLINKENAQALEASLPLIDRLFKERSGDPAKDVVFSYGYSWAEGHLTAHEDTQAAVAACAELPSDVVHYCAWGMSVGIAKAGAPNAQYKLMTRFCQDARQAIPELTSADCPSSQAIGYLHGIYSKEKFEDVIAYIENELGEVPALADTEYYGF